MFFAAVTGSIGCGKTTISDILRDLGYLVYDADKWVKYLYFRKDFIRNVYDKFPETFENGELNKRKLRTFVFDNPDKRKQLELLVHPFLIKRLKKIIRKNKNSGVVFFDVALLFELGWEKYFDCVVLADVDYQTQKRRVMKRDNISESDFNKINNIQMSRAEKIVKSDFVIDTGTDMAKLKRKVVYLAGEIEKCKPSER